MPVHMADSQRDTVGPYNRMSASQANAYKACPRLWFYQKVYRFKMPQIPVLFVGRAVEEAVCRVLRESPGFVAANSSFDALAPSPYHENGTPCTGQEQSWPAVGLMPFFPNERPQSKDELQAWATQRAGLHLPPALTKMQELWEKDERKAGDWNDVDAKRCLDMVVSAIEFHLDEVERCFKEEGGPGLEAWRQGQREAWPAPDGFPHEPFTAGHPLAGEGAISWTEAWEIARPWFVDPDAPSFTMNAIHPDHWFQGEYDLVYRWTGTPVIVDLKASVGANDRSGDYVDQLNIYAMLWHVTHQREEEVSGLQIWYLGHPSIKTVDVPSVMEMDAIESEMQGLWNLLKAEPPSRDACPPKPRPMRGFAPGGQATEAPGESRCERCDWSRVCPGGTGTDERRLSSSVQLPGANQRTPLQDIGSLNPRATIRGELFSVGYLKNGVPLKMMLKQGVNTAHIQVISTTQSDGSPTVSVPAMKGANVLVKDAVFTINWKGEIVLKMDPFSQLIADDDPSIESFDLFDYQAKYNVGGTVVYTYEKNGVGKTGKVWSRKGMMLMDHSGACKVEGWADDWNHQYTMLEVGDVVAIGNLGLDAWASEIRCDYTRNSRLQIIERVDRSTA